MEINLYKDILKRIFDLFIAIFVLIITLPITSVLIIFLSIEFKGKPFFLQRRIGYKNKIFKIYKFRKMTDETDENGNLLPESQRLTFMGKIIRRTSLDEIPQFVNILKGEMSLIGPRPFLAEYYPYYSPRELKRHEVLPGITGLAATKGRIRLDWDLRLSLDIYYAENISLINDIKIIFGTIKALIDSFINPIDDPITVLPYLYEDRAFIRMIYEKDDENRVLSLLSKGKNNIFAELDSKQVETFSRNYIYKNLKKNMNINSLLLIDDYKGKYNSFMFFEYINASTIEIKDYFFSGDSFLGNSDMTEKYKNISKKYFTDLGLKIQNDINFIQK